MNLIQCLQGISPKELMIVRSNGSNPPLGVVLRSESEDLLCAAEMAPLAGECPTTFSIGDTGPEPATISSGTGDLGHKGSEQMRLS